MIKYDRGSNYNVHILKIYPSHVYVSLPWMFEAMSKFVLQPADGSKCFGPRYLLECFPLVTVATRGKANSDCLRRSRQTKYITAFAPFPEFIAPVVGRRTRFFFFVFFCFVLFCFVFSFVSSETKRVYFGFRVNYLHSGVKWPIEIVCNWECKHPRGEKTNLWTHDL